MNKFCDFIKRKKIIKKSIKNHISNGIFFIENGNIKKISKQLFFKNIFKFYKFYWFHNRKKLYEYQTGRLIFGTKKLCLIVDNKAFNFYLNEKAFNKSVKIFQTLYKQIKYPLVEIQNIDNPSLSFETRLINKKRDYTNQDFFDISLMMLNIKFLPETFSSIKVENDFILSYVQHGDCHYNNFILSDNKDGFSVIDIDQIGIYPAFYDFFYFCSFANGTTFLSMIERQSIKDLMNKVLLHFGFESKSNVVDYYLSYFVKYFQAQINKNNSKSICHILYWGKCFNDACYPLTTESVNRLTMYVQQKGYNWYGK